MVNNGIQFSAENQKLTIICNKQHEWISQMYYWMKDSRHKIVHAIGLHLYKVQKQANQIYAFKSQSRGYHGRGTY